MKGLARIIAFYFTVQGRTMLPLAVGVVALMLTGLLTLTQPGMPALRGFLFLLTPFVLVPLVYLPMIVATVFGHRLLFRSRFRLNVSHQRMVVLALLLMTVWSSWGTRLLIGLWNPTGVEGSSNILLQPQLLFCSLTLLFLLFIPLLAAEQRSGKSLAGYLIVVPMLLFIPEITGAVNDFMATGWGLVLTALMTLLWLASWLVIPHVQRPNPTGVLQFANLFAERWEALVPVLSNHNTAGEGPLALLMTTLARLRRYFLLSFVLQFTSGLLALLTYYMYPHHGYGPSYIETWLMLGAYIGIAALYKSMDTTAQIRHYWLRMSGNRATLWPMLELDVLASAGGYCVAGLACLLLGWAVGSLGNHFMAAFVLQLLTLGLFNAYLQHLLRIAGNSTLTIRIWQVILALVIQMLWRFVMFPSSWLPMLVLFALCVLVILLLRMNLKSNFLVVDLQLLRVTA